MRIRTRIVFTLFALLLAASLCQAQTPGNAPQVADTFSGGNGGTCGGSITCIDFKEGSATNDAIICAANQVDVSSGCGVGGSNSGWTFQDSLSTNLTMLAQQNNGGIGGSGNTFYSRIGYTCVGSTQSSYQVNWTSGANACATDFTCFRVKNICSSGTMTADGAVVGNNATATVAALTSVTNTVTTNALNDFVFSMGAKAQGNGGSNRIQATGFLNQLHGGGGGNGFMGTAWQIAPVLGSNSFSWGDERAVNNNSFAGSVAFIVPQHLADTAMPQAAIGEIYSAQLHAYGGVSAAPTYACTGLPANGIALNTATGDISSASVTGSPTTLSVSCTFSDGVTTSPAASLSIQIGTTFMTPTRASALSVAHFNTGVSSFNVTGTTCGDMITIQAEQSGQKQVINGVNNYVHINDASAVQEYSLGVGSYRGPSVVWAIGPLVSGGTKTITVANNNGQSPASDYLVTDWTGLQGILDQPAINSSIVTNTTSSVTTTYPTVVPNEVLLISGSSGYVTNAAQISSMSVSAPFTSSGSAAGFNGQEFYQFGYDIVSSPTVMTPTVNLTSANWGCGTGNAICDTALNLTVALRPRLLTPSCNPPRHRVEFR